MARRADPEKQYKVSSFQSGKYRYAGTQPGVVDPTTGKRKFKHVVLGRLDETNKFIPGKAYLCLPQEEKNKLRFPAEWDVSEIKKLRASTTETREQWSTGKRETKTENQDENLLYGDIWLLENIATKIHLSSDLGDVFASDKEKVHEILTLAYFFLCGKGSFDTVIYWQKIAKTPCTTALTVSMITKILQSLSDQKRYELLRLRAKRIHENESCAFVLTTHSACEDRLSASKYGIGKEEVNFHQTTEIVAYGCDSFEPVYYRLFPRNIVECRILECIVADGKEINVTPDIVIADRGYNGEKKSERYGENNQNYILGNQLSHSALLEKIESFEDFDTHPKEMNYDRQHEVFYKHYDRDYSGKKKTNEEARREKYTIYFDPLQRAREIKAIYTEIYDQKENLDYLKVHKIKIHDFTTVNSLGSYFTIRYSDDATIESYEEKNDIIQKMMKECGFFSTTTVGVDFDASKVLSLYKLRDEQEKYFTKIKERMNFERQNAFTYSEMSGIAFILFIAQSIASYIRRHMNDALKKKFHSVEAIVSEMRGIRYVCHPGEAPFVTPFTGDQKLIAEGLGFAIPEGCDPGSAMQPSSGNGKE